LFAQTRSAFKQDRTYTRAQGLAIGSLLAFGRHTITGILCAEGKQFEDWSAAYRLFENERVEQKLLFAPAINGVLENGEEKTPLHIMMDDTLIRKRGKKVSGTGWKRDPLGPPFHTNFVWGQRYLQISAALPDFETSGRVRGIPIDFYHAPPAQKPRKTAPPEAWEEYRQLQKTYKLSAVGSQRLSELRAQVADRRIVCAVDGGYTNQEMFRSIPENTVLIGRIRKDARLFKVPDDPSGAERGRQKYYGDKLPTPEEIRKDESVPWRKVTAFAAGKQHEFDIKTSSPVRWKSSKNNDMLIVIVRPLAYRPRKDAKLLYRDPAYLICSDVHMPLQELLQAYLWRWEIEQNFRDEKTVFGVGEAQVRTEAAVRLAPAFGVACYAFLLLAAHNVRAASSVIPAPKWYPHDPMRRCTAQNMLSYFRSQYWNLDVDRNKSGFVSDSPPVQPRFYSHKPFAHAVCYAIK
jgi:hypothetical protein